MRQKLGLIPLKEEFKAERSKEVKKDKLELFWYRGSLFIRRFVIMTFISNLYLQTIAVKRTFIDVADESI